MRYVAVAVGAMLGAVLRFVVTNWATEHIGPDWPYGTFLINVSGAFAIGVFLALLATKGSGVSPLVRLFLATGFLGGYTTFSSYAWEALLLAEAGAWVKAVIYVGGSNVVGLLGVWLGAALARLLP